MWTALRGCAAGPQARAAMRQVVAMRQPEHALAVARRHFSASPQAMSGQAEGPVAAYGQMSDAELNAEIQKGKQTLIEMGYHGPSLWVQTICWGDHDQFQHVNNVHYVRFMESNRMLFGQKLAERFPPERRMEIVRGSGESFILQGISVRYRRPVLYPDTLILGKKPVVPLGSDRFTLQCGVYSLAQKAIVATAEEVCVSYDYRALKKIDIPKDFRQALEDIQQNPGK